jgi:hypothetical protein
LQRLAIIAGEQVVLTVLGPPVEPLFEQFYHAYFTGQALPWAELDTAARDYFDQHPADPAAHNDYFNNFISLWQRMMAGQLYVDGERVWEQALQPALAWEQTHPGQRLHKGTPYYFWAMTAIMRRDMDRGYLISHKALQEDVDTSGQQNPATPGYALVSLDDTNLDQAFRAWVVHQAQYVEQLLNNYNNTHARNLTLADLRQKFLTNPPSIDTLFLFTYTLARIMNVTDAPAHTRSNAFAGQVELNLLFDIALVIDASIHFKNPARWKFIHHAEHLLNAAGAPLTNQELRAVNDAFQQDFDTTLREALDGALTIPGKALNRLQCDIALAYGIRNYGAHNTGTAPTIYNRFDDVQRALFRTLFTTVEYLY